MKPQVKESEKSRILQTRDYSIFEFPDVTMSKKFLSLIKDSISEKNLTPDYPILIDDSYNIIDGRYKFLACYELKLPIHYKVAEVTTQVDAIRVKELMKKTSLTEIINAYKDVNENYANVVHLHSMFNGSISIKEILICVGRGITKTGQVAMLSGTNTPYWSGLSNVRIDRYKLASGKLPKFDVGEVERRITTAKYVIEEFKWDHTSAFNLIFYKDFNIDFPSEANLLRQSLNKTYDTIWSSYCEIFFNKIQA